MKKILLYGFGGSYNHGGEAIVSCTIEYLRKLYPGCFIYVSTHFKEQDIEFHIDADCFLERDMRYVKKEKEEKNHSDGYDSLIYADTLNVIESGMECYSVGGDNYCYGNWHRWKKIHDEIIRKGASDTLWSCSIDKEYLNNELIAHLSTFNRITAREQLTYNALVDAGLNNVERCRDVAFALKPATPPKTYGLVENKTIVLNVSPLVIRKELVPNIVIDSFRRVISFVLNNTNLHIILLPHVRMPVDDDMEPLKLLYDMFKENDRLCLVEENLSAAECKYLISKCVFGIFARTHAAIAAYSSGVPCIVLGYSAKAKGIAMDEGQINYHISLDEMTSDDKLETMLVNALSM